MTAIRTSLCVCATLLLGACVALPSHPLVTVMPGPYKPFDVFQADDQTCRGYAQSQMSSRDSGFDGEAPYLLQRRYDLGYAQCMYAKGNQVPGFARAPTSAAPPPPETAPPPPPPPS